MANSITDRTKRIKGVSVTPAELERYDQVWGEMIAQGHSDAEADMWATCSIGIGLAARSLSATVAVNA